MRSAPPALCRLPSASIAAPATAAALTNLLLAVSTADQSAGSAAVLDWLCPSAALLAASQATKSNGRTTAASRSAVRDADSLALSVPVSITANGLALGATSLASAAGASSNIHLLCWGLTWCGVTPAMLLGRAAFASDSYRYLDPAADHRLWSAPGRMLHQAPSSCSLGRVEVWEHREGWRTLRFAPDGGTASVQSLHRCLPGGACDPQAQRQRDMQRPRPPISHATQSAGRI